MISTNSEFSSRSILEIQSSIVSINLSSLSAISILLTLESGLKRINIHFPLCIIYTSSYLMSSSFLSYDRCPNSSVSIANIVFPISLRWSMRRRCVQSQLPVYNGVSWIKPSNWYGFLQWFLWYECIFFYYVGRLEILVWNKLRNTCHI